MRWLILLLVSATAFSQELSLKRVIEDALANNLELKAYRYEIKAYEREYRAARGSLFPRLKLEETFTKTDIPAYVLFTKLNQERIRAIDFTPSNLNNPNAISNFETKLSIEIPIWMGGKIRAFKNIALHRKTAEEKKYSRKEEEVIFKAYEAYLGASLARSAIGVTQKNIEDAREHLRIAKKLHKVGMALLSDVLRAEVFLKKAEEKLTEAENNYKVALKALGLVANRDYSGYEISPLRECPSVSKEELKEKAFKNREDLIAIDDYLKVYRESYKATIADNLPQIAAFASYSLYDKDVPFGSDGSGYMFGVNVSVSFDTGLSTLQKARSFKERERALIKRKELMKKAILFEVEKAYAEYETALSNLKSAKARVRSAEEMVRILNVRYENGLARIVDLLDAQTQLENARFDYIQALYRCNLSYGKALLAAGVIKEVLR